MINDIKIDDAKQFDVRKNKRALDQEEGYICNWIKTNMPTLAEFKERIVVCINKEGYSEKVLGGLAKELGGKYRLVDSGDEEILDDGEIPVFWGVLHGNSRLIEKCKLERRLWIFCDHAYINRGHENKNYRMSMNSYGMNRLVNRGSKRLDRLNIQLSNWREKGEHVLICPPTRHFSEHHKLSKSWTEDICNEISKYTSRELRIRSKPQKKNEGPTLEEDLDKCHALVCHMSNVAIDAVISGTPVFVNKKSAAIAVGSSELQEIETPTMGNRQRWIESLSWNQFTIEEISNGKAIEILYDNRTK